jgi:hypothetical protein
MMEEALRFAQAFEVWIYVVLAIGGIWFAAKFIRAWNELRRASFGLERESAQARVNRAASMLVLLFLGIIFEFVMVTFAAPSIPGANPLLTPTLNFLATPTITLSAEVQSEPGNLQTPEATNLQPTLQVGCIPDQVMLTQPEDGSTVEGIVPIIGTANIPNFGFYKFEMATQNENNWLSIEANNNAVVNGQLGNWNTTRLDPGIYQLRLVVTDNQGQTLPACVIQINIIRPQNP